jgi:hypothetical protein
MQSIVFTKYMQPKRKFVVTDKKILEFMAKAERYLPADPLKSGVAHIFYKNGEVRRYQRKGQAWHLISHVLPELPDRFEDVTYTGL